MSKSYHFSEVEKMSDYIAPFTALVTAYNEREEVDLEATRRQMRRQIKAGNNLFCSGTNGDFSALSFEERVSIVKAAMEEANGEVKVFANAGTPSTFETIRLAKEYAKLGIDGIAVVAPYFISCTQEGLFQHYKNISESVDVPVYIYDIPSRTGNPVAVETVLELAKLPNIKGIKDTSGNADNLRAYCDYRKDHPDFDVFTGPDHMIHDGLVMGATGCVSGLANVIPSWVNDIIRLYAEGDVSGSAAAQEKVTAFRTDLYKHGFPPALVKRALFIMDPAVGNNRMPALIPSEEIDTIMKELLDTYSLK